MPNRGLTEILNDIHDAATSALKTEGNVADDAAFTVGTTVVTPVAGTYKATRDAVDDGDAGAVAINAKRGQFVTLEDSSSVEIQGTDQDSGAGTDKALDVGIMVPASGGGVQLGLIDDAAFTIATSAVMPMGALADDTSPDSVDEGDVGIPRMGLNRILLVQSYGDSFLNITTATTTTVKSGQGYFARLVVNKHVASGVITMYDSTSAGGTKIGTITEGGSLLADPPIHAEYGLFFSLGLTVVTSAAEDLTFVYR